MGLGGAHTLKIQVGQDLAAVVQGGLGAFPREPLPLGAAAWVDVLRGSPELAVRGEPGLFWELESVELWGDPIFRAETPDELFLPLRPFRAFYVLSLPADARVASPAWDLAPWPRQSPGLWPNQDEVFLATEPCPDLAVAARDARRTHLYEVVEPDEIRPPAEP